MTQKETVVTDWIENVFTELNIPKTGGTKEDLIKLTFLKSYNKCMELLMSKGKLDINAAEKMKIIKVFMKHFEHAYHELVRLDTH